ncbi:conserved hypothetical protein [Ricinus communis]|uniref:NAD(P)-binding domain-containing protein n=1 Tax=Ricinus communis TaxID=3988 RepID=B9S136_RICCO|nr:conserved hypothetical protein [Ricinus communis]
MATSCTPTPFILRKSLLCTLKSLEKNHLHSFSRMEGSEVIEEITETQVTSKKKIFVAGATGSTGKRIVEQLLAKGFEVKAGVRDVEKAKSNFVKDNPSLQIVKADVTDGSAKLAEAIGDDSEAVICATGFRPGWDLFAPWKAICYSPKLQAEQYIRRSGIKYTIIRPGGLKNDPPSGNVVMEPEDTLYEGNISRDLVAEVAVEALVHPESSYKVVEIVSRAEAPRRTYNDLFGSIKQR